MGILKKIHIKNLRGEGSMRSDLKKKLDSFTLETSKNHLIRNFLSNGHLRVKIIKILYSNLVSKFCIFKEFHNLFLTLDDRFLAVPNGLGVILGLVQLLVRFKFSGSNEFSRLETMKMEA